MTDIVLELREWQTASNVRKEVRELARRAADEIERLRKNEEQHEDAAIDRRLD
jgi:hypothetical protein